MKLYIASNYNSHPEMRGIAARLEASGHFVTSEWIQGTHGSGDQNERWARIDIRDLEAAEGLVLFTEDFSNSRVRGGKHVEFGYAMAKGKRLFIIGARRNVFHSLSEVAAFAEIQGLIDHLKVCERSAA